GCSEQEDAAFRRFYVENHALDAGRGSSYARVIKYEFEELGTKANEASEHRPRYLTIHEADADLTAALMKGIPAAELETGPELWQRRRIAWRHLYRRVSSCIYPGARYAARML